MKPFILAAGLALSASMAAAVPTDYVALYQFDSADASDSSANGNDGTIVGGVTFGASMTGHGNAAVFTPTGGLSGINTGVDINRGTMSSLTMGGWVYADSATGKFMSHDNGSFDRTLGFDTRGDSTGVNVSAFTGSGVADIDGAFTGLGSWIHYTVVYDGASSAIYMNGALAETFNEATGLTDSSFSLFLGTNPGFNEDFDGMLDDVFVYDYALSDTDIADIYTTGFTAPPAVPLPAGMPFLIAGMGGLALFRRKS